MRISIIGLIALTATACIEPDDGPDCGDAEIPYNGIDDDCEPGTPDDDVDGDGFGYAADCDDQSEAIYPGAVDICDGLDNDCDGEVDESAEFAFWYADRDGDGAGDPETGIEVCDPPGDFIAEAGDCDDDNPELSPAAEEVCDGIDNNCDGQIDEGLDFLTWYEDGDGDGYGDSTTESVTCDPPVEAVFMGDDCNDTDPDFHPGANESDCTDPNDYNCDGMVGYADVDGDGWAACDDCDDSDPLVNYDASEICNGLDDDCDGEPDDGLVFVWYFIDNDGDGWGSPETAMSLCEPNPNLVTRGGDCDDSDPDLTNNCQ